jgi:hypothetical protein
MRSLNGVLGSTDELDQLALRRQSGQGSSAICGDSERRCEAALGRPLSRRPPYNTTLDRSGSDAARLAGWLHARLALLHPRNSVAILAARVRAREPRIDPGPSPLPTQSSYNVPNDNSTAEREMSETTGGSEQPSEAFEPLSGAVSGAVSEYVAARRLGLSVDALRRDRRLGQLGIPFVKYGEGKRGAVRYDLADLERFIESRKQRGARPIETARAPVPPTIALPVEPEPAAPAIEPAPLPLPQPTCQHGLGPGGSACDEAGILPRSLSKDERRAAAFRRVQELLAWEPEDIEPEDIDPFASAGRAPQRRGPGGYFSGG